MGKYSKILLCSDLDRTLLNNHGELSNENFEAIRRFSAEGGHFCISTGRLPSHLLGFFDKDFFSCPVICCNGACIYDFAKDSVLNGRPLGSGIEELCEFIAENSNAVVTATVVTTTLFSEVEKVLFENFAKNINEIKNMLKSPAYKIVMRMDSERATLDLKQLLINRFGDRFNFSRSWDVGLEILDSKATKGHAAKRLQSMIGGGCTSICVGDYENDITMIESADIGCAVANAVPGLKAVADRIICSNDEHAIKYIVENICDDIINTNS